MDTITTPVNKYIDISNKNTTYNYKGRIISILDLY